MKEIVVKHVKNIYGDTINLPEHTICIKIGDFEIKQDGDELHISVDNRLEILPASSNNIIVKSKPFK